MMQRRRYFTDSFQGGNAVVQVGILLPLTLIVRSNIYRIFDRPLRVMSLRAAVDMDKAHAAQVAVPRHSKVWSKPFHIV